METFLPLLNSVSVKLEILIAHVLQLSFHRKKIQNLSHFNCGLQIRRTK